MSYAKLFGTITDSSLWSATKDARILFVSMLARADATGFVEAALPGLARMANLTLPETEAALAVLMASDPYSKSTDHDGRRVVAVPRGWCLVTYMEYRERRDEEEHPRPQPPRAESSQVEIASQQNTDVAEERSHPAD